MIIQKEADDDDDEEDPDDSDYPDEADEDSSVDTKPCPYCHKPIYDRAEVCPHCGNYISAEESRTRKPLWMVLAVAAVVAAFLLRWVIRH